MSGALPLLARAEPLRPAAAAAEGEAARRLADRLLTLSDQALARLEGVAGVALLVVLGAEADLPWVDGIRYLGRDPGAPSLLLPTAGAPAVPLPLLELALGGGAPPGSLPLALLPDPLRLVPLGGARPLERARLAAWREAPR